MFYIGNKMKIRYRDRKYTAMPNNTTCILAIVPWGLLVNYSFPLGLIGILVQLIAVLLMLQDKDIVVTL